MHLTFTHRESPWRVLPARHTRPALPRRTLAAAGVVGLLLLSGCGGGGDASSSEAAVGAVSPARGGAQLNSAPGDKSVAGSKAGSADASKPASAAVNVGPKLTKSASLDLRVKDISAAASRVRTVALGLQALILGEQIGKGGTGGPTPFQDGGEPFGGFGTLTLSVPSDQLDVALDQLAKIGTVLQRNTTAQDVTSQYIDTQSRLKTMTASVARVRALMAEAKDLGQVVQLEGELSRRESDLESLQSQMDALKTSVERSTVTVSLSTPGNEPVTDNGFLAGLHSGWDAFTASAAGLLLAVGAVLPFAVFFALVGAPIWLSWSRRRASRPAHTPAGPAPTVSAPVS